MIDYNEKLLWWMIYDDDNDDDDDDDVILESFNVKNGNAKWIIQ